MKASSNKSMSKPGTLSSSRDLSPTLMDWCASLEGQRTMRKLGNQQSHLVTSESPPMLNRQAPGTRHAAKFVFNLMTGVTNVDLVERTRLI
jgi:hypothetical protein